MSHHRITYSKSIDFSNRPEILNASLHFAGLLFGLIAIPLLILSSINKNPYSILDITVYGICFLMVFTFSTLFHSAKEQKRRRLFKKLDRISIYFLIAGTYTPFVKFYVFDNIGSILLTILWSLVLVGVLFEMYFPDRYGSISVLFYLFMGLLFLFRPHHFFSAMPEQIVVLVIIGISCYITGVYFYISQRWKYNHAIWHLFVLAGSICHYMAILYTL